MDTVSARREMKIHRMLGAHHRCALASTVVRGRLNAMLKIYTSLGLALALGACSSPPATSPTDVAEDASPAADAEDQEDTETGDDVTADAPEDAASDPVEQDLVDDPAEDPEREPIDDADAEDTRSDDAIDDAQTDAPLTCGAAVAEPYMELGTGVMGYVSWDDVDTALLSEGIQGGFHVWGGLEAPASRRGPGSELRRPQRRRRAYRRPRLRARLQLRRRLGRVGLFGLSFLDFAIWPPRWSEETWELCMDTLTSAELRGLRHDRGQLL